MHERSRWTADYDLCFLMGGIPNGKAVDVDEESRRNSEWLRRRHQSGVAPYAIEVNGRYIGDIDFGLYPGEGKADLTVLLGEPQQRGKGYGTEAVELVIGEMFRDRNINYIEVDVASGNSRALSFWTKLGFSLTSVDTKGTYFLRRYRDTKKVRIALASSQVGPFIEENLRTVENMVGEASQAGADLVCFPEGALGFDIDDYDKALGTAIAVPGKIVERIGDWARTYNVFLEIGVLEREVSVIYDSALLFSKTGQLVLVQRRLNPQWHKRDDDRYKEGTDFLVAKTPYGTVGLAICGDTGDPWVTNLIRNAQPDCLINPRNANFPDFGYSQTRWDKEKGWACRQAVEMGVISLMVNAYSEPEEGGAYGGAMVVSDHGLILRESKIGGPSLLIYEGPSFRL